MIFIIIEINRFRLPSASYNDIGINLNGGGKLNVFKLFYTASCFVLMKSYISKGAKFFCCYDFSRLKSSYVREYKQLIWSLLQRKFTVLLFHVDVMFFDILYSHGVFHFSGRQSVVVKCLGSKPLNLSLGITLRYGANSFGFPPWVHNYLYIFASSSINLSLQLEVEKLGLGIISIRSRIYQN